METMFNEKTVVPRAYEAHPATASFEIFVGLPLGVGAWSCSGEALDVTSERSLGSGGRGADSTLVRSHAPPCCSGPSEALAVATVTVPGLAASPPGLATRYDTVQAGPSARHSGQSGRFRPPGHPTG